MKWIVFILIGLAVLLQYRLWIGEGSLAEIHALNQKIRAQEEENKLLIDRNHQLEAEVADLKHGKGAIEERARSVLGMIKEGEVFYQIITLPKP